VETFHSIKNAEAYSYGFQIEGTVSKTNHEASGRLQACKNGTQGETLGNTQPMNSRLKACQIY